MFGVSPAFVISKFGPEFTSQQYAESLSDIAELGYGGFQPEVFEPERLDEWTTRGARLVGEAAENAGLVATQFVAHFLLHGFEDPEALQGSYGIDELAGVCESLRYFPGCRVVTVPLPAFRAAGVDTPAQARKVWGRLCDKVGRLCEGAARYEMCVALEVMPYSLVGGLAGLRLLFEELGLERLGYNYDTGHAWSSKELVELVPLQFEARVFGTHLCDNHGRTNYSLVPGNGTIPWNRVLAALRRGGYRGSLDVEVRCSGTQVARDYAAAKRFLETVQSEVEVRRS